MQDFARARENCAQDELGFFKKKRITEKSKQGMDFGETLKFHSNYA